jgi:tetratricopeptide (TPR) repeat protein
LAAEHLLKEVLQANPDAIEAHRWLATIYYDLGAANEAVEHLLQVGKLDPSDHHPFRLLGLMNKDYEIFDRAVVFYKEALHRKKDMPDREEVLLELADCYIRLHDYASAKETLDQAGPSADRDAMTAEYLFNMGKTEEAVARIEEVLQADPNHLRALQLRGEAHLVAQENQQAAELYKRAVDLNPFDYEVRRKYATALQRAGDDDVKIR